MNDTGIAITLRGAVRDCQRRRSLNWRVCSHFQAGLGERSCRNGSSAGPTLTDSRSEQAISAEFVIGLFLCSRATSPLDGWPSLTIREADGFFLRLQLIRGNNDGEFVRCGRDVLFAPDFCL